VYDVVDRALGNNPQIDLYLNIALDGYGETHDRIRGVPGNWDKALECIESLYPLKEKYTDRFRLNVNTVVCAENYTEIEMLSEFMWDNYRLDGQYFNIIRGETLVGRTDQTSATGSFAGHVRARFETHQALRRTNVCRRRRRQAFCEECRLRRDDHHSLPHAARKLSATNTMAVSMHGRRNDAVIDYNGDVRACELREKFASLADFDYDFGALWAQTSARRNSRDRRRQSVLVHARLLHSRLDAPFASRQLYDVPKNYLTRESW
jgi:MoaA/NifB/PqqE/SkfB family radical SAM enzyme